MIALPLATLWAWCIIFIINLNQKYLSKCTKCYIDVIFVLQDDEDLTFDDEGVVRSRREIDVAPVASPLHDSSSFFGWSDDEDAEGSAIEGSGVEPRKSFCHLGVVYWMRTKFFCGWSNVIPVAFRSIVSYA